MVCLSFHWTKALPIGKAGAILVATKEEKEILDRMRFDGRTAGVPPKDDNFVYPGNHCYMLPEEAARGLMLMSSMPDDNSDLSWDDYPDLSKFKIFRNGYGINSIN